MVKSKYITASRYSVSEWRINIWHHKQKTQKKQAKEKNKITLHKGHKLSEETIITNIKLLNFVIINIIKLDIPLSTLSLKFELLNLRPDLLKLISHGQLEYIYIDLCKEIIYL